MLAALRERGLVEWEVFKSHFRAGDKRAEEGGGGRTGTRGNGGGGGGEV